MDLSISRVTPYTSLISFVIGLPTLIGTYYVSWKARQESKEARQGLVFSDKCLEFITDDGISVNVIPLQTLHSLPKPGDIVLLPGPGPKAQSELQPAAYRVSRVEHIYTRVEKRRAQTGQARLAKAVAHVLALHEPELLRDSIEEMQSSS